MPCRKIHAGRPQTSAELRSTTPYLLALMQCVVLQMEQYWLAIHPSLRQHLAVQPQELVHDCAATSTGALKVGAGAAGWTAGAGADSIGGRPRLRRFACSCRSRMCPARFWNMVTLSLHVRVVAQRARTRNSGVSSIPSFFRSRKSSSSWPWASRPPK